MLNCLLLGFFIALTSLPLYSQDDCSAKIQEAQRFYDQGMIEEIPQMLAPCMEDGFTRAQKVEAYKLIILSYLFNDDQFEAEKTMVEFLKKYPEYEIMPNDPIEFVYLFETYRTTSIFSFGITAGFNYSDPRIIEPYTMLDFSEASLENFLKPGFQVGFGMNRYINRHMLLNLEFNFASNQYKFNDEIKVPLQGGNDAINSVTYTEKLYKFEFPVSLSYEFNIHSMNYFVRAGLSAAKLSGVTGQASRKYSEDLKPITSETLDMAYYRKNMLYSGIIGAGVRYKVPRGVVIVDFRANLGLNNIVNPDHRFENEELSTSFYYLDDDFSINSFSLSAAYYFSFYTPKKQR